MEEQEGVKRDPEEKKRKYYPRAYKRLFLQERDLQILNYGLEQKFLTVDQIMRKFFKPKEGVKHERQAAYRRVLTLQKFGMVKLSPILTGEKVVVTTETGAGELANRGLDHLPSVASVDYRYYEHDRRVTDTRILFESLNLVHSWKSERHLKSNLVRASRVPDALFMLKNGQVGALEVEIARKGKERYRQIFEEYLAKRFGRIDLLFYVCNTLGQLEDLAERTKDYRWVYYALYDQLMKEGKETVFANEQDHFRLREL